GRTGVQAVVIEGNDSHVLIPTPNVVNSCSVNPETGEAVCVANNNDVYLIEGTNITKTLQTDSSGFAGQSGGSCNNCSVTINAATNQAVISVGLAFTAAIPFHTGLQTLDLNANKFSSPIPARNGISEGMAIDPFRGYILSATESSN